MGLDKFEEFDARQVVDAGEEDAGPGGAVDWGCKGVFDCGRGTGGGGGLPLLLVLFIPEGGDLLFSESDSVGCLE